MVRHCVKILKLIISKVNPHQITVMTADQPVYALGKQIQWKCNKKCKDVLIGFRKLAGDAFMIKIKGKRKRYAEWIFSKCTILVLDDVDESCPVHVREKSERS